MDLKTQPTPAPPSAIQASSARPNQIMTRFGLHYFFLFGVTATFTPYLPLFLKARGFQDSQVGLLLGFFEAAGVCGPLLLGSLADRLGRRRVFLMGAVIGFALMLIPLNAISYFWLALPFVMLAGFIQKIAIPMADALSCSELPDASRQYGWIRAIGSLGWVVTLIVIWRWRLVDESSSAAMMFCTLVMAGVGLLTAIPLPDHHRAISRSQPRASAGDSFDRIFWLWMAVLFMGRLGLAAHYTFFTLYLKDVFHVQNAAWYNAIGSAAEIPVIFFAGWIVRRFSLTTMMIAAMLAISVRLLVYAAADSVLQLALIQVLHALAFGLFHVASIEFIRRKVDKSLGGTAMAIYVSLGYGLPALVGSAAGGYIVECYGYHSMFLLYSLAPVLSILCLIPAARKLNVPPRA